MNRLFAFTALVSTYVLSAGCNQLTVPTAPAGKTTPGIAVIDLDEVARQLGSDQQIVTAIKKREEALNGKLSEIAKAYTDEFKKQKETLDAQPAEDNAVQLATYQKQVNQNFSTAKAQAQQNLSQHRQQLIAQFRDAVRPAARKVAQQRGLSVIVTKQEPLLYDYSEEADITSEVVEVLRASAAKKTSTETLTK
ncbi:OmpH family outer membrane protein [Aeoliella sp. SH292]|uniref:OmpH family outer membrane protein n=1 Tax=Aeoliella sp. SH292 TaxID=3454464 RepID=UPI003F9A0569